MVEINQKVDQLCLTKETMSSLQIAEITGKRHADVLEAIRNMESAWVKVTERKFSLSEYTDTTGRRLPCYQLNKIESLYIASKFNDEARAKLVIRWEELENEKRNGGFQIPTSFREALLLAAQQQEQIEEQQKQLQIQAPKVEFFDTVAESKTAVDMKTVAKTLNMGMGRNNLFEILRDKKVLDYRNRPYQKYVDLGWFKLVESKYTKNSGEVNVNFKTVVFQKGIDGIRKILANNKQTA